MKCQNNSCNNQAEYSIPIDPEGFGYFEADIMLCKKCTLYFYNEKSLELLELAPSVIVD